MIFEISVLKSLFGRNMKKFKNSRLSTDSRKLQTLALKNFHLCYLLCLTFPCKHRFGAKTLMSWFSNLSAIYMWFSTCCHLKRFHEERENSGVLLISYYSVQPDKNSFAFSLNRTACDLRERNDTRRVTTSMVDVSLHRLCRPYSEYSSILFKKKYGKVLLG